MTRAGTIALADIAWIRIYENRRHLQERKLPQMLRESGGDLIFNGPIFLRSGKPCCHLKSDGKVLCHPGYTAWCAAWNNPPTDFCVETAPNDKENYVETCHLIIGGKKVEKINCGKDMRYACNRTAIGTKQGRFAYLVTETNYTPEGLRDYLFSIGWDGAILLDGGGSSCIWFSDGTGFIGSDEKRVIPFYIAVKLKKDEKEETMKKKVLLDAGHYAGCTNASADGSYKEDEFALDISRRIAAQLERHGVEVGQTRRGDEYVTLDARWQAANRTEGLDLFVSLHSNASPDKSVRGYGIYSYGAGAAAARNRAANALLAQARAAGLSIWGGGLHYDATLAVLRHSNAPAILVEHGFHTNAEETALLKAAAYRAKLAEVDARGILDYLGISWRGEQAPPAPWYAEAQAWATAEGLTDGTRPEEPVSRAELWMTLQRMKKKEGL